VNVETGTAIAIVGAGIFQIHDQYSKHAGELTDIRNAPAGDIESLMRLQDADVLVGATALIVGGTLTLASGKVFPLAIAVVGYILIAGYYHYALNTTAPIQEAGNA
jgi:hypothetical protein